MCSKDFLFDNFWACINNLNYSFSQSITIGIDRSLATRNIFNFQSLYYGLSLTFSTKIKKSTGNYFRNILMSQKKISSHSLSISVISCCLFLKLITDITHYWVLFLFVNQHRYEILLAGKLIILKVHLNHFNGVKCSGFFHVILISGASPLDNLWKDVFPFFTKVSPDGLNLLGRL